MISNEEFLKSLSNEDKKYRKSLKKKSDNQLILLLLADLIGGVSRTNTRKCVRLLEAYERSKSQ